MKKITNLMAVAFILLAAVSCKKEEKATIDTTAKTDSTSVATTQRIVSLSGAVTEIVAALGHEKEIVGVDVTSTYPENVKKTATDLGHVGSVSIEAIMALRPTLILTTDTDADSRQELIEKIKNSGVKAHVFTQEYSTEGSKKLIAEVAEVLGNKNHKALQDKIDTDHEGLAKFEVAPKVLFIYARGANMMIVSVTETPVEKMIALAGGQNAVTDFEGYKPLTPEALIKGNPDVILMFDDGLKSLGGMDGLLKIPGVNKTNAGKNKRIISMDGALLSGFGPRTGEATKELNKLLTGAK